MPDQTISLIRQAITESHEHIAAGRIRRRRLPDSHLSIMNMVLSDAIKTYRLWPQDATPAKNTIRLDFIYLISGSGGGFSELSPDWHQAFWDWMKPYRDMSGSGHWYMNDDAATRMCMAMREHYEAKLPKPEPVAEATS